ncbi:MAG: ATP-dependent RNA helicase HrpA [Desulfobacterales bacterium]
MSITDKQLKTLIFHLPKTICSDRPRIVRKISRIRSKANQMSEEEIQKQITELESIIARSKIIVNNRRRSVPRISYNRSLPITKYKDEIIRSIKQHQILIISGETGSGKTTQIPKFCLEAGRGIFGKIGCTQPRRIAAVSIAGRIAEELGENIGQTVGFKIRFKDQGSKNSHIKMMTDGILLAETQKDRFLNEYDTIIVDEAHERSLNIDFILGILKSLQKKRKDLKIIITSATIDTDKFSKAFHNAPILEVSGRLYPVEVNYVPESSDKNQKEEVSYTEQAAKAVDGICHESTIGDILIFMPTEQDIRETCDLINGRHDKGVAVLPLFARLSAEEQKKIFKKIPDRKIIVSTNIAETSITIPGIRYVVDTGLARISSYSPRSRITSLPIVPVSKSSADQRKGRCGRVENGTCIRLFSEEDYESRSLYTLPEIRRANLADVILRMISLNLGEISEFPFIDRPSENSIKDGYNLLRELDALTVKRGKKSQQYDLSRKGRMMARIPLDPRLSAMLIEATHQGCLAEVSIIASALSIQDPRERPADKTKEADQAQAFFSDPLSDFMTLLNIWTECHHVLKNENTTGKLKKFCKQYFLSFRRMKEWQDIHRQVSEIIKEAGLQQKTELKKQAGTKREEAFNPLYTAIHKSIIRGFLSNIAVKKEKNIYKAAKDREVMLFPGSSLFNNSKTWIVAAEFIETSRLFIRTVAAIDCEWLEEAGKSFCRSTYLDPHWERNRGEVVAIEQVSLFGLIIVPRRKASYGNINPEEASEIFIRDALVGNDLKTPFSFMIHNQHEIEEIKKLESRLRRRNILIDTTDLCSFYKKRLPDIYDIKSLKSFITQKGGDLFLKMNKEGLYKYLPEESELSLFPEKITLGRHKYECRYVFNPGNTKDGVTVRIPSTISSAVPSDSIDWLVPGLYKEKITYLIRSLPKEYRKQLVPVSDTVDTIIKEMPGNKGNLLTSLSNFIAARFNIDIPVSEWPDKDLPDYLKMRIAITDIDGKTIVCSRDREILTREVKAESNLEEFQEEKQKWEKESIISWDFPDLPESITLTGTLGNIRIFYPGLEKKGMTINLRLFQNMEKAFRSHQEGIKALFMIYFSKDLKFLKKNLSVFKNDVKIASGFGGAEHIQQQIFNKITNDLFLKNIRTRKEFLSCTESIAPRLLLHGKEISEKVSAVISAFHNTRSALLHHKATNRSKNLNSFFNTLADELKNLVPDSFITIYETERLDALPRYLRAIELRIQRALNNFEKDREKTIGIEKYIKGLNELLAGLSAEDSEERRREIENFFWLIQEYKVSIFAQELKTPFPVSSKKLEKKLNGIKRIK